MMNVVILYVDIVRLQYMKEIDDILKELGRPGDGLGGFYIAEIKRR